MRWFLKDKPYEVVANGDYLVVYNGQIMLATYEHHDAIDCIDWKQKDGGHLDEDEISHFCVIDPIDYYQNHE